MITHQDLAAYEGREHAKAKHDLLERYVQRYAMIVGQSASSLAFVDCFSGPWKSATDDLTDTSFGLSLRALEGCAAALKERFGKRLTLRALWMEADDEAFERLDEFARRNSTSTISIEAVHGKFQDQVDRVAQFAGSQSYAFIFIDPKGYKGLIEPDTLQPLLRLPKVELLINYMWSHIRWAIGRADDLGHMDNVRRIYGPHTDRLLKLGGGSESERQCLVAYESELRARSEGVGRTRVRVLSYPILDTHGQQRTKYYLVHTTHSPKGLTTFAEECDRTNATQNQIFQIAHLARRDRHTGMTDLFANQLSSESPVAEAATEPWLHLLKRADDQVRVDANVWADLLESGRCLPSALQKGFKELLDNGVLRNLNMQRPRKTKYVNYEKNEVVRRMK